MMQNHDKGNGYINNQCVCLVEWYCVCHSTTICTLQYIAGQVSGRYTQKLTENQNVTKIVSAISIKTQAHTHIRVHTHTHTPTHTHTNRHTHKHTRACMHTYAIMPTLVQQSCCFQITCSKPVVRYSGTILWVMKICTFNTSDSESDSYRKFSTVRGLGSIISFWSSPLFSAASKSSLLAM